MSAMWMRAALAAAVAATSLASCGDDGGGSGGSGGGAAADKPIVIGLTIEPDDLDPHALDITNIDHQVFDGLVRFNADGQLEPELAEELPVPVDDVTWEVKIRQGVTFHDGTALDAEAVAASFNDSLLAQSGESEAAANIQRVESVEAVDESTIRLNLSEPDPLLDQELATSLIVKAGNDNATSPVGTGAYRFVEWKRGESVELERNEDYWGPEPQVSGAVYRFLPDESTQAAALETGEIDIDLSVSVENLGRTPSTEYQVSGQLMHVQLNTRAGVFADERVRRAANLAVDKDAIAEELFEGAAEVLQCQHLKDDYIGFNDELEAYPYDPDEARRLVEEAGAAGTELEIITTDGRAPQDLQIAEVVAQSWTEVGLVATPRVVAFADYLDLLLDQDPPEDRPTALFAARDTRVLDGSNMNTYFLIDGAVGSITDEELDAKMREAGNELDIEKRADLYEEAFARVCDQAYFTFLVSPSIIFGFGERISALHLLPYVSEVQALKLHSVELS